MDALTDRGDTRRRKWTGLGLKLQLFCLRAGVLGVVAVAVLFAFLLFLFADVDEGPSPSGTDVPPM